MSYWYNHSNMCGNGATTSTLGMTIQCAVTATDQDVVDAADMVQLII
jgi:hypothetical protein